MVSLTTFIKMSFLNEPQKKEWDFVLEKRVKEIEE